MRFFNQRSAWIKNRQAAWIPSIGIMVPCGVVAKVPTPLQQVTQVEVATRTVFGGQKTVHIYDGMYVA
jgi:hypothetical protein